MSLPFILLIAVAALALLLLVVFLLMLAWVKANGRHGVVARFSEPGDGELPPEERVKHVGGFKHGSA